MGNDRAMNFDLQEDISITEHFVNLKNLRILTTVKHLERFSTSIKPPGMRF